MEKDLKLLKDICIEFPPDVKKISLFIRENMDVELMNWKKCGPVREPVLC